MVSRCVPRHCSSRAPATPNSGDCSSAGRALDCDSGGRGFEPRQSPHSFLRFLALFLRFIALLIGFLALLIRFLALLIRFLALFFRFLALIVCP